MNEQTVRVLRTILPSAEGVLARRHVGRILVLRIAMPALPRRGRSRQNEQSYPADVVNLFSSQRPWRDSTCPQSFTHIAQQLLGVPSSALASTDWVPLLARFCRGSARALPEKVAGKVLLHASSPWKSPPAILARSKAPQRPPKVAQSLLKGCPLVVPGAELLPSFGQS